ncbi:MAG: HAD-IC family P-type ATPase [Archangium sp.]|nr:HAD-IC family P-type ATPase [Archangium sp.]
MHWHAQSAAAVVTAVKSNAERGLSAEEAAARLATQGPNRLSTRRGPSAVRRFVAQFTQPLVVILIAAAVVSAVLEDPLDAAVIAIVVLANAIIGYLQESRAEQAIAALDQLVVTEATVLRDGVKRRVPSDQLVCGDVVSLQSGDSVPADLRLLQARELQIEEAALTGESVPTQKTLAQLPDETALGDRTNLAFAGTQVTYGTATGVVVATGDATETGRIADLLANVEAMSTPLTRRIEALSRLLLWVILGVAVAMIGLEALRGASVLESFDAAVALAVGAIPEGLPAAVTVLLAVGVSAMATRGALVRKLPAVETLGSTTVICSDKTGTLTENQMTVTAVWTAEGELAVSGIGYDAPGALEGSDVASAVGHECLLGAALCTDTRLVMVDGRTKVEGDPTEAALLVAAKKAGLSEQLGHHHRLDLLPFESQHMYMASLNDGPGGRFVWVKGSAESILKRCATARTADGVAPLHPERVTKQVEALAAKGLRVLCIARRQADATEREVTHEHLDEGLVFLGLVGMIDPPRAEASAAIATCQRAGVKVKMITGDHAATAAAIAAQLGIEGRRDASGALEAISGLALERLSDAELPAVADAVAVFARVAPEQKLRLVKALQQKGHVVAMTGDGVNDAPALKQADLGISMGRTGTDVARRASAMILTDDNFATIAAAVEEGRGVYENLVKFLAWSLPTNGAQGFTLLIAVAAGVSLPILPVQMLWVNMATAIVIGTALIFEPREAGLMERAPRPVSAPLLDGGMLFRIVFVSVLSAGLVFGAWYWALEIERLSIAAARTIAVNAIVVVGVAYLFNCRSLTRPLWRLGVFGNKWVWWGSLVMLVVQVAFTYLPFMQRLFHTEAVAPIWWLRLAAAGALVFAVVELKKVVLPSEPARVGQGHAQQPAQ